MLWFFTWELFSSIIILTVVFTTDVPVFPTKPWQEETLINKKQIYYEHKQNKSLYHLTVVYLNILINIVANEDEVNKAKAYFVFTVSIDSSSSLQDIQGGAEVDGKTWSFHRTHNHHLCQL